MKVNEYLQKVKNEYNKKSEKLEKVETELKEARKKISHHKVKNENRRQLRARKRTEAAENKVKDKVKCQVRKRKKLLQLERSCNNKNMMLKIAKDSIADYSTKI